MVWWLWTVLALVAALAAYMIFESQWFAVTRTTLTFNNLPPDFDGFRIVLVSDFHSWRYGRYERRVVAAIRSIEADLLVIAGDLKARNTTPNARVVPLLDALLQATAHYPFRPVYVCGNHDRRGFSVLCDQRRDMHSLRDASIVLQRGTGRIVVAGTRRTARQTRRMRQAIRKALCDAIPCDFTIFVAHSPDFFRMAARRGASLVLSGDTHGGQIRLPWWGPILPKTRLRPKGLSRWRRLWARGDDDFTMGRTSAFGGQLYVSRGLGTTGPPFRFLCRPEVAVLTLKRTSR